MSNTTSAGLPTRNRIPEAQNEPRMLDLLRAKTALYDATQTLYVWQFYCSVVFAIGLLLIKIFAPIAAQPVALGSVLLFAVDWGLLDPRQKELRTLAARMQEVFDCQLFEIPYRTDRVGAKPDAEVIANWSRKRPSTSQLRNWYSPEVGQLPLPLARVACQRSSANWNARMRTRFSGWLKSGSILLVLAITLYAVLAHKSAGDWAFWAATILPMVSWSLREARRQAEAAEASTKIAERGRKLWERLLNGSASDEEIAQETRELQNDIFDQRRRDQQVFGWVYRKYRDHDEETMRIGVADLVDQWRNSSGVSRA